MKVGGKFDKIVKLCCEFFIQDDINVAKKTLYEEVVPEERYIEHVNDEDDVMDIGKLLHEYSKENQQLPKFLIYDPQEISAASELGGACITSAVNQMCRKLDNFIHCTTAQSISYEKPLAAPPSYALIVKNPPKALSSHKTCKNVFESGVGLEQSGDIEIRRGMFERRVLVNCSNKAEKVAGSLKNIDPNSNSYHCYSVCCPENRKYSKRRPLACDGE